MSNMSIHILHIIIISLAFLSMPVVNSAEEENDFELAMGCDDNDCLLENVAKLAVKKIVTGS